MPPVLALVVAPRLAGLGTLGTAVNLAAMWALAVALFAWARLRGERSAAALGMVALPARWVLIGVGVGVGLAMIIPLLSSAAAMVLPSAASGSIGDAAGGTPPLVLIAAVVTAAFTEEFVFRSYALDALAERTGSPLLAALVSLAAFTATHMGAWNAAHIAGVVIPLGAVLTALYLWRRNLWLNVLVHLLIDLPLVVMAAASAS
jgi:membrane protease YdiL (CAAX protease family)